MKKTFYMLSFIALMVTFNSFAQKCPYYAEDGNLAEECGEGNYFI